MDRQRGRQEEDVGKALDWREHRRQVWCNGSKEKNRTSTVSQLGIFVFFGLSTRTHTCLTYLTLSHPLQYSVRSQWAKPTLPLAFFLSSPSATFPRVQGFSFKSKSWVRRTWVILFAATQHLNDPTSRPMSTHQHHTISPSRSITHSSWAHLGLMAQCYAETPGRYRLVAHATHKG